MSDPVGPPIGAEGIVPNISYAPARRAARDEFKPWHRPRKQFVRREQWLAEARWLLAARGKFHAARAEEDVAPLSYLGLPGADLLDIRFLHAELCVPESKPLLFLGFDESARPESASQLALNVSLDEIRKLPHIAEKSDVRPEDIRILGDPNSAAWDDATNAGPFDIINIDLCEDFRRDEPSLDGSMYRAVTQLLGLQRHRPTPWSMLLTTKTDGGLVSPETWTLLVEHAVRRLTDCPMLLPAAKEAFGAFDEKSIRVAVGDSHQVATLCISLWIATLASKLGCRIELSNVMGYTVGNQENGPDMVSLAFRFTPDFSAVSDEVGLVPMTGPALDDSCRDVAAFPEVIDRLVDADVALLDRDLFAEFVGEMANILETARYDSIRYRAWAATFGGPPPNRSARLAN